MRMDFILSRVLVLSYLIDCRGRCTITKKASLFFSCNTCQPIASNPFIANLASSIIAEVQEAHGSSPRFGFIYTYLENVTKQHDIRKVNTRNAQRI